ncbi:MAG TPA: twin-arginine translocation signal domain-containing protein [Streptosporangiaceae bacterium]|nr:twin-arginine translocation signal domain-containing protein [Streptosporangiaceae bacterium]
MSTSPVDPQDIRAAAEVHRELGPEYSDAVIAAFIERVDRAVEARVQARLAEERPRQPVLRDRNRRTLLKGVALGVGAGALVAGVSISHAHAGNSPGDKQVILLPKTGLGPGQAKPVPGQGELKPVPRPIKPPAGQAPPPAAT